MPINSDATSLRYFLAVAESQSYSGAARMLRITQPAVSRQLQSLERSFGTRLLRRDGHRFVLTDAGRQLALHARDIVARIDALQDIVHEASRQPRGPLSLGVPWAAGEYLLPEVLRRYRKKYPQVTLSARQGNSDRLADDLVAGTLDIAVLYQNPRRNELEFIPLLDLPLGLVAPPPHAKPPVQLRNRKFVPLAEAVALPLVLPSRGHVLREMVEEACAKGKTTPSIVMETDSATLSKALVRSGQCFMVMAHIGVHDEVERGELRFIPIGSPEMHWRMSIAVRRDKPRSLAIDAMSAELATYIRAGARRRRWHSQLAD